MYRDLNAAKSRPDVHLFSCASIKSARTLGKVFRNSDGTVRKYMFAILKDVDAVCNASTLAQMATRGANKHRSVAAWITGVSVDSLPGRRVAISLNPKNGETEFRYRAPGRAIVQWSDFAGVEFTSAGMLGILKEGK